MYLQWLFFLFMSLQAVKTDHWDAIRELDENGSIYVPDEVYYSAMSELSSWLTPEGLYSKDIFHLSNCTRDILHVRDSMRKLKSWALQMADSTAKFPEGLLKANHEFLGLYDECRAIEGDRFNGQHCVLRGEINMKGFPGVPARQKLLFFYGTCVPSTCSADDMTKRFNWVTKLTSGLVSIEGVPEFCHTAEEEPPSDGAIVVMAFICFLGLLGLLSTAYDVFERFHKDNNKPSPLWSSFSLYTNGMGLFTNSSAEGQMGCLSGLRVLSMIWIVYFHVCTTLLAGPIVNVTDGFAARKDPTYALLFSAFLSVDTFLLLSGLLLANSFFKGIRRSGTYDAPLGYVHRYLRLTPSYAMLLLFQVTVFPYIGDGPMWTFLQDSQTSVCKDYWWSGLLYVQNYVNPYNLCLTQTWYLSADMQLYWLSPLLFYPMYKWRRIGIGFLILLILGSVFLPFALAYQYGFSPLPLLDTTGQQNRYDNYPTYSRATPWLVGVALGYYITELNRRKIKVKLSKTIVFCGWFLAAVVSNLSLFGVIAFLNDKSYKPGDTSVAAAFYLPFHRLGWSYAVAWMIFACIYGYGGPIDGFLSWSAFQTLGKLSYSVYLTHVSVILYRLGIIRTNVYFNLAETFFMFLSVWLLSHLVGILLYLFIEMPFLIVERHLLRNVRIFPFPRPKPKPKEVETG